MHFESRQKETPDPISRKRQRKGTRGERAKGGTTRPGCQIDNSDFLENLFFCLT
jgi:hypothetical protein